MKSVKPTCLGSGVYMLDTIVVREYPEGYRKQRKFNETVMVAEVAVEVLDKVVGTIIPICN